MVCSNVCLCFAELDLKSSIVIKLMWIVTVANYIWNVRKVNLLFVRRPNLRHTLFRRWKTMSLRKRTQQRDQMRFSKYRQIPLSVHVERYARNHSWVFKIPLICQYNVTTYTEQRLNKRMYIYYKKYQPYLHMNIEPTVDFVNILNHVYIPF